MAKTKISLYDPVAANNTDINSINIAEGMAPSDVNNAIRELMAEIKQFQAGSASDPLSVGGALTLLNTLITSSSAGTAGQVLLSQGSSTPPAWGTMTIFPVGAVYISTVSTNPASLFGFGTWVAYGTGRTLVAIDTGNALMDVVGETFGGADAIVPSHTHTFTGNALAPHSHTYPLANTNGWNVSLHDITMYTSNGSSGTTSAESAGTPSGTISTTGVAVTNQNYQPSIAVYIWNRTA
jgi:hypothetical protein